MTCDGSGLEPETEAVEEAKVEVVRDAFFISSGGLTPSYTLNG